MSSFDALKVFVFLRQISVVKVRFLFYYGCFDVVIHIHINTIASRLQVYCRVLNEILTNLYPPAMGAAIFFYDYLVTLGMEIDLVWSSQWNFVKFLFLFQRYMPFFDTFLIWVYREYSEFISQLFLALPFKLFQRSSVAITVPSHANILHIPL